MAALVAVSVVRFVGGSEAATGERRAMPAATVTPVDPPLVSLGTDAAGTVPSDRPLRVSVTNGTLTDVA
ncbi:MAG TPA: hypothetical protein VGR20_15170, partial [Acidimicrobiia bacterium]|nr:hypothetical protein [Acidimicrobiia bacterium]